MDRSVHDPEPGSGAGAFAPAPVHLPPEKAEEFFENFKKGKFSVIMLGDVERQPLHWVSPSEHDKANGQFGHMELCTASFGSCHHCRARLAGEVLINKPQSYRMGPALVRAGDRGDFEQRVAVFTEGMWKELCDLVGVAGWRGLRFGLRRESAQKYKFDLAKRSQTFGHKLPPAFALLPFIRARWELPQKAGEPIVLLPSYKSRELTTTATLPETSPDVGLTATDCQKAEEAAKVRAIFERNKGRVGLKDSAAAPVDVATPPPAAATVLVSGADVPVPEGTALPPPGKIFLVPVPAPIESDRDRRKRAAEAGRTDNALSLDDEFAHIVPSNGKHDAKKGGTK
jgi:hypothetical protein